MNYGNIKNCDIANGIGVRVTLFVSGCTNRCEGCFQPETWDFNYGKPFIKQTEDEIISYLAPDYVDGLTLLGGEPMEPLNQLVLLPFVQRVKEIYPQKTIWIFSGFTYEELTTCGTYSHTECTDHLLELCDVLVDGRFEQSLKNLNLRFRGSSNQRIIDLKATRAKGEITLWQG